MRKVWLGLFVAAMTTYATLMFAQRPTTATHVPNAEIIAVYESLNGGIDRQVRIVDVGGDTNVGVGILQRRESNVEGEDVGAILHHQVTEVYYVLSGSGVMVSGGSASGDEEFPAVALSSPSYWDRVAAVRSETDRLASFPRATSW